MRRPVRDWGGNIVAFAATIAVNILSNTLPINGQSMADVSARYQSLFTPAGYTFSIWGVIYLFLLLFVVYQALPAQRDNELITDIGPSFRINCLANAAWLFAFQYELLSLSLLIMTVLLGTLIRIYRKVFAERGVLAPMQYLAVGLPFSLYFAWICVATLANLSAVQVAFGWSDAGLTAIQWTILKLGIVGAIGTIMLLELRDLSFGIVVAWAACGIAIGQTTTPMVSGAAAILSLVVLLLGAWEAWKRLRAV